MLVLHFCLHMQFEKDSKIVKYVVNGLSDIFIPPKLYFAAGEECKISE